MVGLTKIKEDVINTLIYYLVTENKINNIHNEMLHSVITGLPGCGKTTFIEILAKIYVKIGLLSKGHIVKVKRSDLIGKYLGNTAIQTQKKIDEALGGILLIDEAYSLGNPEGRDSFSKECLDTLNQALSEEKAKFICIIAGYKNALDNSFFNYNEGLKRRFPFRYDIEKYTSNELSMILYKKIIEKKDWILDFTIKEIQIIIKNNYKIFNNSQGGGIENIFLTIKILQNKRVFLLSKDEKKILKLNDINNAIKKFTEINKVKESNDSKLLMYS